MKPLVIIQIDPLVDPERVKELEDYIHENSTMGKIMEDFNFMVIQGDAKIIVAYPHKPISYYFNKLKAWVFLKIWKRKRFSNTSVII